jgi:hypothetical protein
MAVISNYVFIVTCYLITDFQKKLLLNCVDSIHRFYPDETIQVLDDNHSISEFPQLPEYCKVEKTIHSRCGEVNAYVWACKNINNYNRYVFIHDSTQLLSKLPTELPYHYRAFWYSSECIDHNTRGKDIDAFIKKFKIKGKDVMSVLQVIRARRGNIAFGGMAIWDNEYNKYIIEQTNFLSVAHLLNKRPLRSFFERLVYIIYYYFQNPNNFRNDTINGNIMGHKNTFNNKDFNPLCAGNPYLLKIWQGR